jgi:4-amino-4-deoxy-L-arabinose transferase-like glycosyltransferase
MLQLNRTKRVIIILIGLAGLMILGYLLRSLYLQRMILHVDEFLSLLSMKMILEKGLPILPTGIFHGKGIVYAYLGAGVATIFQFKIEIIRYLSLVFGVLTIPVAYLATYALFRRQWAAFLAAVVMTIYPTAIIWGGRVRMYSLAEMLVFLLILFSWLSLAGQKGRAWSLILAPLTLVIAILTHPVTVVIAPALALALALTFWRLNRPRLANFKAWRGIALLAAVIIFASLLSYWLGHEPGEMRQWQEEASVLANISRALLDLRLLRNFYNYFLIPENITATILALIGLVGLAFKIKRRTLTQIDDAAIFIYTQLAAIFLGLYILVPSDVRDERHNFIVLMPFLTLALAYGAVTLTDSWPQKYVTVRKIPAGWLVSGFYVALVVVFFIQQTPAINTILFVETRDTYRYDEAFEQVNQRMAPGDALMSVLPAAAYLYRGPLDYYANQHKPRFLENPATGQQVDYYTGGIYLASVEEFSQALDQPGKLWFVIDEERLLDNYSAGFSQEVLHQMALVERLDNMLILVEKEHHWQMPAAPDVIVQADFLDQMRLVGYSTQLVDADLRVTLFWEALNPIFNYKVFVHLRDRAGNTVAQADFLPFDNLVHMSQWRFVWRGKPIPTGTVLNLSPEIMAAGPDQYQIFIGLYLPELNSERVPLTGDVSGENAFILNGLKL